jgi:hypothetical protein
MLKVSNNLMMLSIINNLFNQCNQCSVAIMMGDRDVSLQGIKSTSILVQKELIASLNLPSSESQK